MKRVRKVRYARPADVIERVTKAAAPVVQFVWNGMTITRSFARRPRVLRLEPSRARGSGVGEPQGWWGAE